MKELTLFTRGKINRKLHITGLRSDGYHLIDSYFQPLGLSDKLQMKKASSFRFRSNEKTLKWTGDNLCKKALDLLEDKLGRTFILDIYLEKRIPLGAGLAGGTANGAGLLKGVNRLFNLGLSLKTLQDWSLALGADFPYCLADQPVYARGIGEILEPMEGLDQVPTLLLNPGFSVASPQAYRWYDQVGGEGLNHLERGVALHHPEIHAMKEDLLAQGAWEVAMTGSGPTVYGLFESLKDRDRAALALEGKWAKLLKTRCEI